MKIKTIIKENNWLPRNHPGIDFGWGNGYALIPQNHPAFGVGYDHIEGVKVNGGLTFSRLVDDKMVDEWPELSQEDKGFWIIGFDTCHCWDTLADWTKEAVQAEADKLGEQLEALIDLKFYK